MSVCAMMILTLLGVPISIFCLVLLHQALRGAAARFRAQGLPLPLGAKYAPGLAVAVLAIAIAVGFGQGWRGSHPCQETAAAPAGKLTQALACLAR